MATLPVRQTEQYHIAQECCTSLWNSPRGNMNLNFNDQFNYNSVNKNNIIKFDKNYQKNKPIIDGYCDKIIESIKYNYKIEPSLNYILKNSYFLTITYSFNKVIHKNDKLSNENSPLVCSNADKSALLVYEYRNFYNRFTRSFTNDRNFMTEKPHDKRPITYCFLDAEGTRWSTFRDEYKNIHLHALMVIPDTMHNEFQQCMINFFSNQNNINQSLFATVDVQKIHDYGLGDQTIPYVLSYASKFIPQNSKNLICKVDQEFMPRYCSKSLEYYY